MTSALQRHEVRLEPGSELPYDEAEWSDALVRVQAGEVDVECASGGRCRFVSGDILWFEGLELRVLRNPGTIPTLLIAISHKQADVRPG